MWDNSWQKIFPNDGVKADNARALAAVPVVTGKAVTGVSNISESLAQSPVVHGSSP
jgi:hypothetical protein